jgi:hypothetical protein
MHLKTLMRLARIGGSGIKIGKHWFFRASTLNEWIDVKSQSDARATRKGFSDGTKIPKGKLDPKSGERTDVWEFAGAMQRLNAASAGTVERFPTGRDAQAQPCPSLRMDSELPRQLPNQECTGGPLLDDAVEMGRLASNPEKLQSFLNGWVKKQWASTRWSSTHDGR